MSLPTRIGRQRRSDEAVAQLVARAAAGEGRAWDDLVEEFGGLVWATVRTFHLCDADAADAAQCTWLRLVEHLDRLRDPARVGPWLATTARREALGVIRRSGRILPCGDDMPEVCDDAPSPSERLVDEERAVVVRDAMTRLHPRDRALLWLLAADCALSYEEIGAALEMPVGSIGPTRARALQRLRREVVSAGLTADSYARA